MTLRSPFYAAQSAFLTFRSLTDAFRQQGLGWTLWLAMIIFVLALIFAFLAFAPILSPFVYPLF